MSELEQFLTNGANGQAADHPLLRLLEEREKNPEFKEARIEVRRPRDTLGFQPAAVYLHFIAKDNQEIGYQREEWDNELNAELVNRQVLAMDEANEAIRFGLALSAAFEAPERRFGDGFFSSVLVDYLKRSPFGGEKAVQDVLCATATSEPYRGGLSDEYCRRMIDEAVRQRWQELTKCLGYSTECATRILVGAIAYYLDERFSVTDRRKLGWG